VVALSDGGDVAGVEEVDHGPPFPQDVLRPGRVRLTNGGSMKRSLKKISVVLLAAVVGLLVAELALRLFSPRYYPIIPAAYEYDAELAHRLRPGAHLFETTDHQQETVANGLGTANFQEGFDGYESLVFAVGDSYTQGTGVPADAAYPAQLDLMLNRDEQGFYVRRFGVVNLGVAGFGGEQSLANLGRFGERLGPPAFVLYLGCDNDFEDDLALKSGDRHRTVVAGSPVWGRMTGPLRFVFERTHLGRLARAAYRQRVRDRLVAEATAGRKSPVAELESSVLERLKAYAEARGSVLVVSWSGEGESYEWLKSWAGQRRVAFADWAPRADSVREAIRKLPPDNPHSGHHHRTWVNQLIAAEFARQIRAGR
jgi:hypothetical protein